LIRRLLLVVVALFVGAGVVLGVEVWLALRREYLPSDPRLELDASFGPTEGEPLRFVVLGDSTSAGIGSGGAADAYPTLLAKRLAEDTGRRVDLTVLGISGARTADVLSEQIPKVAELRPDVVFVGIGANDVTHLTPLDDIKKDMSAILAELATTEAEIAVAGAPDMRVYAWHQPLRQITYLRGLQVADAIEEVAHDKDVAVVELQEQTGHFFAEEPEAHFSEDEFHPSALGYKRWADAIYPVVRDLVSP
jgi:lysophospholipase L1-like esterase